MVKDKGIDLVAEIYKKIDEQVIVINSLFGYMDKIYHDVVKVKDMLTND